MSRLRRLVLSNRYFFAGWRRPWPLRVGHLAQREAGGDRSLAPTAALDNLQSGRATGRRDGAAHRRDGQYKILPLRDIADPTNQGSAPAGQEEKGRRRRQPSPTSALPAQFKLRIGRGRHLAANAGDSFGPAQMPYS